MFLGGGTSKPEGWMNIAWLKAKDLYDRYPRTWIWKSSGSYEEELCSIKIGTAAVDTSRSIKATGAFVPALTDSAVKSPTSTNCTSPTSKCSSFLDLDPRAFTMSSFRGSPRRKPKSAC